MSLIIFSGGGGGVVMFFFMFFGGREIYWEGEFDVFAGGGFFYWRSRGEGLSLYYIYGGGGAIENIL